MISISSMPKAPPSPACGFNPLIAMRGRSMPDCLRQSWVSFTSARIASTDRWSDTSFRGMCEVTRAFQTFSRTLNSRTLP